MKKLIIILTIVMIALLLSGCEKDPVIVQDVESNSVITYLVEAPFHRAVSDEHIYYCEYIDPELEEPQQIILNKFNTPWKHDVIAKGDIEQYHCYFRYYGYIVTDTNYGEWGETRQFLDSDFTQEPNIRVYFLHNGEQVPDSCLACSVFPNVLYPREDGLDWNHARDEYFSRETSEYYWSQYREDYKDWSYYIYLPLY